LLGVVYAEDVDTYFSALPAYLGGKRKLAPLIFALLDTRVPRSSWQGMGFVDPFLGGGSVSLFAKLHGFRVVCNDLAIRSAVVGRAFIANGSVTLDRHDVALLLREPDVPYPRVAEERYVPSVFSREHARFIDRALWWARTEYLPEPKRSLALVLMVKLMLRIQPMSMLRGTDARAAFSGDYDLVSPRRVGHYVRSLDLLQPAAWWRLAQEMNQGVLPGEGEAYQENALALLPRLRADVVYLDPPYPGTTSYEREYAVLDDLLEGKRFEVSGFSRSVDLLGELFQACRHIPVWLVSLNNAALELDELQDLIRPYRPNINAIQVPYRHLASIASEEKNAKNKEFIVLATE
jgi:adenine-specific DNA-methyltransferase